MSASPPIALLPDAGPLITLAYADSLDLLLRPGWQVMVVDVVLHEVTRSTTPTSQKIADWVRRKRLPVLPTQIYQTHQTQLASNPSAARRANLGELAAQEALNHFALAPEPRTAVFLFEDHKIAKASFVVPHNCRKVSTRAFLGFLEQKGWIESASAVERRAIQAGRAFSQLRFSA